MEEYTKDQCGLRVVMVVVDRGQLMKWILWCLRVPQSTVAYISMIYVEQKNNKKNS